MTETTETEQTLQGDSTTVRNAAKVLGVDPARVRQWVRDGRLTAVEGSEPLSVTVESLLVLREQRQGKQPAPQATPRRVLADLEREAARAVSLEDELRAERTARQVFEEETRRELRVLERAAGRSEVLEETVTRLQAERDSLAAQVRQEAEARIRAEADLAARSRRRWRKG
jgi:hypothetical protein